jgi:hypothetical protein
MSRMHEAGSTLSFAQFPFERLAGLAAIAVGIGGLAYSIAFLVLLYSGAPKAADVLSNVFLLAGGILATAVFVALYERFRPADPGFALWAFLLGSFGAIGSAAHGAYDLANIVKTPKGLDKSLPSATDPRGFATFGLTALAIALVSVLILRVGLLPRPLAYLGLVACALLLVIYFGRLIIFNPKSPGLLTVALLTGFLVNPAWYAWLGLELWRGRESRTP